MEKKILIASIKKSFLSLFSKQSNNTPEPIENNEIITRFIFNKNGFSTTGIKAAAFLPNLNALLISSSVFRKSKMGSTEYNNTMGNIKRERQKNIKAVACVSVQDIFDSKLGIIPEEKDHRWHADIIDWPEAKSEQKLYAQILAKKARKE
jgi:hypothetical protein